ncbi:MAG: hypothetical protein M1281_17605, partial [Chloroflexi bacterium]|nr:hypothetical protein [Chloroflexota bacterium]
MFVLHAHWQPPVSSKATGGVLLWGEASDAPQPPRMRGLFPPKAVARSHPYLLPIRRLQVWLKTQVRNESQLTGTATLWLPSTRTGPLPSPELSHSWELDRSISPCLLPWRIEGIWLPASEAISTLVKLSLEPNGLGHTALGADLIFWKTTAILGVETLASQKILPVVTQVDRSGRVFEARWLPVLDSPEDAARLRAMAEAMPPVCRAEFHENGRHNGDVSSPSKLLDSFLNTLCDAAAREWGKPETPKTALVNEDPVLAWLRALFTEDAAIKASAAQLQALESSHRAWTRKLHVAGDRTFRIAFRLEAPAESESWQLHYLLQARDDPSLLVPADEVWKTRANALNFLGRHFELPQEKLLAGLGYAGRFFAPIQSSLKVKKPSSVSIDTPGAYAFLRQGSRHGDMLRSSSQEWLSSGEGSGPVRV